MRQPTWIRPTRPRPAGGGIAAISDTQGLSSLPEELQELAQLRLAHPDMTLRELSGRLGLTRSGVNHRLQRLLRLGEKILEEKGVDNLL